MIVAMKHLQAIVNNNNNNNPSPVENSIPTNFVAPTNGYSSANLHTPIANGDFASSADHPPSPSNSSSVLVPENDSGSSYNGENGHDNLHNGFSIDDNNEAGGAAIDNVKVAQRVETCSSESAENNDEAKEAEEESSVEIFVDNGAVEENQMEDTVSHDANDDVSVDGATKKVCDQDDDCCYKLCRDLSPCNSLLSQRSQRSSSSSNQSQAADFLDIDMEAEPEDDYFTDDLNRNNANGESKDSRNLYMEHFSTENNLNKNAAPPTAVAEHHVCESCSPIFGASTSSKYTVAAERPKPPQDSAHFDAQVPGPSNAAYPLDRGEPDPEDEGVICQEAGTSVTVTTGGACSSDCEACMRNDVLVVGVLPPRLVDAAEPLSNQAGSSRRRSSQQWQAVCIGGPNGKRLVDETLMRRTEFAFHDDETRRLGSSTTATRQEPFFVWSLMEANRQTRQLGPSACGATSISNVLCALRWEHATGEQVGHVVPTRMRAVGSPLAEYLLSRSVAGVNHTDLISAMETLSWKRIRGRFFHMYPRRSVNIVKWLLKWLKKGAIPVITANLQRATLPGQPIADAWHHQMVFGADAEFVHLANPVERLTESVLQLVLCSPSVLLIRAEDVHQHWVKGCDLNPIISNPDFRWTEMNVVGQILGVIREYSVPRSRCEPTVTHLAIPACYMSGVTLFAPTDSSTWTEITVAEEMPEAECKL